MAGYQESLRFDLCNRNDDARQDAHFLDYSLDLAANYRVETGNPFLNALGNQPSFWGPLRGQLVTKDSFLQGRGQPLSRCADAQVRMLPASVFGVPERSNNPFADELQNCTLGSSRITASPDGNGRDSWQKCQRTDLQMVDTRTPKSCNGLPETQTTYAFMPSSFQPGYLGFASVVPVQVEGPGQQTQPFSGCRENYGTYGNPADYQPYMA